MEAWWILAGIAIVCWAPIVLLRPLVVALANRIAGKNVDAGRFKLMQKKLDNVEEQLQQMQHRLIAVEESNEFGKRLSQDAGETGSSLQDNK